MRRALAIIVLMLVAPAGAHAATPATGTVHAGATQAGWTGTVDGTASPSAYAATGGTRGFCRQPQCDTFTLSVEGAAVRLELRARSNRPADSLAMEVVEPDGTTTYVYNGTDTAAFTREHPAQGTYTLNILAGSGGGTRDIGYGGQATLVISDRPAPEIAQPASAEHPYSSPDVGTPQPQPAPVQPLRLFARADAASPRVAARRGMRVRVRCAGGCAALRIGIYVSPLTARQYGWGVVREDLQIGQAAVTEGADGRVVVALRVLKRYRRRLARTQHVRVAVEAVATAADGRTATVTRRMTLRR